MKEQSARKKIVFWLRVSGWLCLLPAAAWLYLFRIMIGHQYLFLIEVFLIVIFAVYILTTADSERWQKPDNIFKLMMFAIIFVSVIDFFTLWFAYNASRKLNNH
ncbi:hypothetical protein [Lactobacillus apis]|uniref:hypothetical protein n=1 Tax=Lactobacillus apis TaxID=303541 RepID=UPI00243074CB|nr:hypothetical protein [Lactobacillus apis]